jgi:hypothetical protein
MARLATAPALAVVLAALVAPPALAAGDPCEAVVKERLARMNIDPGDVRSISIAARVRAQRRSGSSVSGFDAWVSLKSCRGSIVMSLSRECRIKRIYSKGDCKVPN